MSENQNEFKKNFIKERIVPRKKLKKIVVTILSCIGLAVLFGLVAAVTFSVGQNILVIEDTKSGKETIIIAQDDTKAPTKETQKAKEQTTVAPTADSKESQKETEPTEPTQAPIGQEPLTLKTFYEQISSQLVWLKLNEGQFGIVVATSETKYFVLTDASSVKDESDVIGKSGETEVSFHFVSKDTQDNLAIYSVLQKDLPEATIATLGNSFSLETADPVFFAGSSIYEDYILNEGAISFAKLDQDTLDGYEHFVVTNMLQDGNSFGAVFNESGEMVGWMANKKTGLLTFTGISPLKKTIEILCYGEKVPYLGIHCMTVSADEASEMKIEEGLYVEEVDANSPAYNTGIQVGDQIKKINQTDISNGKMLQTAMNNLKAGESITILFARQSGTEYKDMTVTLVLGER